MKVVRKEKAHVKKQTAAVNKRLLSLVLLLVFLGLIAVIDASAPQALNSFGDKFYFFKQQGLWAAIGVAAMLAISRISYNFWKKMATPLFFGSLILLVAVLIPNLSYKALGARRWLDLGLFSLQPSEVIKLALVIYFAKLAESKKPILSYFIPLTLIIALVMLQPDLGTTIIISLTAFSQIFVSGVNLVHFFGTGILAILSGIGLILASPYRRDRLTTFLETTSDPLGKGYHIRQILLGLGSGGIFGAGLGASRQKYLFLPEASTDSIFAVIAEELGFLGGIALIALFVYFAYLGFKIARNSPDVFAQVAAVGITSWISGQAIVNISSMVSLTPLTGVPLPFFSYGGSSLVMILVGCGILLSISRSSVGSIKQIRHGK